MTESTAFGSGAPSIGDLDLSRYGSPENQGDVNEQPLEGEGKVTASPPNQDTSLSVATSFTSIQEMVMNFTKSSSMLVVPVKVPVINDNKGRYYEHYKKEVRNLKTSIISEEALGFYSHVASPKLTVFEYRGKKYYFSAEDTENKVPIDEIRNAVVDGDCYELVIFSQGEFIYDPIQLAILSQTFSEVKSDLVEVDTDEGLEIRIRVGIL